MSKRYVGWIVSLKCNEGLDTYQGQITDVIEDKVTLTNVFCNGIPHTSPLVTLDAKDILQVTIISTNEISAAASQTQPTDKVTVKRPIAKRAERSISELVPSCIPPTAPQTQLQLKKAVDTPTTCATQSTNGKVVLSEPTGKSVQKKLYQKQKALDRDEHTFGSPIDQSLHEEFDFEKNLALFNKEAVWQEINSLKPDIVRQSENNKGIAGTYRPDENIIDSKPTVFKQILVPYAGEKEYVTDNGLVIPSITLNLHQLLIGAADRLGMSWERRVELLGRAGAEIILQLLGGSHRLNPNNAHQWPTVVALCGSHRSGAAGVNCARQLSSHGVKTIVFVENTENVFLLQELSLYKLTKNKVETKVRNLPTVVDLIVVALCNEYSPRVITPIARWANSNKAPILAIEPPSTGTPGILSKFSLLGGLPLSHSTDNGRLYLCNLALPQKVYTDVGITYKSPFGPKFVIPLHSNDS